MDTHLVAEPRLPEIWTAAYTDVVRMVREMYPVLVILCALFLVTAMGWFTLPLLVNTGLGKMVMRFLLMVGCAYVAAPYYVALHRFVVMGEVRWIPRRDANGPASDVYLAWAAYSQLILIAPLLVLALLSDLGLGGIGTLLFPLLQIVSWVVLVRLTTLLPMAALAPKRVTWHAAWAQTRGRFWNVLFATTTPAVPAYVALLVLMQAAGNRTIQAIPWMLMALAALLAVQLLPLSVATRFFWRVRGETA